MIGAVDGTSAVGAPPPASPRGHLKPRASASALPRPDIARSLSDLGYAVLPRARGVHVPLEHRAFGLPALRLVALAEQLLYQVLFPASLPLMWAVRGGAAARNLMFVPGGGRTAGFLFQLLLSLAVWAQVGLFVGSGLASVPPASRDSQWYFLRYDLGRLSLFPAAARGDKVGVPARRRI